MKSGSSILNSVVLLAVLVLPVQLPAQHTRYKLIDIGTFGGSASYFTDPGIGGAVLGPGYVDWDFSAFKNIQLTESKEIQFRGELFNFLNHTNFRLPVSDIESPTFGQIQSDVSPRVIQVALKFLF